ncbi:MAG: DnaJ C-terminal domain-containing protein [Nitratireductor sp.]
MRDPYAVLGVNKAASEKDIKSAFRKMAKKYHPDQNQDNPKAQAKFAEVNQAYEIVGDKAKRGQFDRGEIDNEGKPKGFAGMGGGMGGDPFGRGGGGRQQRGGSPFGGAEDILNQMFGGGGFENMGGASPFGGAQRPSPKPKSPDVKVKVAVTLDDLARGKTTVILPGGDKVAASIPAGAKDGQTIRLAGKGKASPGASAGDVLATLIFKADNRFKVEGSDLRAHVQVPLKVAVLGGSVFVETLDGKLALKIPPWTNSGKVFRLKGRGLPKKDGSGDMMIVTQTQLPDEPDEALIELLKSQGE